MDILKFIVLILILAGIGFAYFWFRKKKNVTTTKELTVQERIDRIRTAIKNPKTSLSTNQQSKITKYKNTEVKIEEEYKNWDSNSVNLKEMCLDGCKFLEFHLMKNEPVGLKIADAMVTKLLGKLDPIKGEVFEVNPWPGDWYETTIILTYFLALYVYIGTKTDLVEGCKKQILRILPSVGVSLKKPLVGLTLFKATVSRLCVTYLIPDKFRQDVTSGKFAEVKEFMNLKHIKDYTVQDGYYNDGSVILDGFASYERLESTLGFYESAYRGMGLQTNIKDLAVTIFPKLTHPKVHWSPLGLFRNSKDRIARSWSWTSSDTEINLIPFIGLGVFKCPDFMFFVRVQRPLIHPNYTAIPELAAGCIQIRRIFRKDNNTYPRNLTKANLKDEPGVLSKANGSVCELTDKTGFYCSDVSSFIGCIDKLMFWKNSYKFIELFGDVTITEAGVITASGFQARYKIDNNSNEIFKFRYTDPLFKQCHTTPEGSRDFFNVPRGSKEFTWTMADTVLNYKVEITATGMKFEIPPSKKYEVKTIEGDNEPYVVTCGSTTLLGSSSSRIPSEITYETKKYTRNSKTMMYEK